MSIGSVIADVASKVGGNIAAGVGGVLGAQAAQRNIKPIRIAGAEQSAVAGAFLGQAIRGQAVGREEIAPQITGATEQAAQAQRGLLTGLQTAGGVISPEAVASGTQAVSDARTRAIRGVFAEQAALNLRARQQAAQQILQSQRTQAQLRRGRQIQLAGLRQQELASLAGAVAGASRESGEGVSKGLVLQQLLNDQGGN